MKRTRLLAVLAIAVVAGLLVTGCKNPTDLSPDTRAASHWVGATPEVFTIWANPHTNVGSVSVWNTPDSLYITYTTTGRWWLEATDTHVALKLKNIPRRDGSPNPNRFEFQSDWHPRVQTCTLAIEMRDGWDVGKYLYIATHSVVVYVDNRGRVTQREEAWAGPYFFEDGSLCCYGPRYIKYQLKSVYKDVTLPTDTVQMAVYDDILLPVLLDPLARFRVALRGVPPGYDVWDAPGLNLDPPYWPGWCAEHANGITPSGAQGIAWYKVRLWSSLDPNLPKRAWMDNTAWDKINYLLNHKDPTASVMDIQVAIWYLMTPNDTSLMPKYPLVGKALAMYTDAMNNGDGFLPSKGQLLAVIADAPNYPDGTPVQRVFIEVDP